MKVVKRSTVSKRSRCNGREPIQKSACTRQWICPTPSCVMNCMHLVHLITLLNCTTLQNLKIIVIHYASHPSLLRIIPSRRSLSIIFRRGSFHSCSHTRHILGRSFGGDLFDNCGFFRRFTGCSFGFGGSEGYGEFFVGECIGC